MTDQELATGSRRGRRHDSTSNSGVAGLAGQRPGRPAYSAGPGPLHGRRRAPPPADERARAEHVGGRRLQPRLEARARARRRAPARRCSTPTAPSGNRSARPGVQRAITSLGRGRRSTPPWVCSRASRGGRLEGAARAHEPGAAGDAAAPRCRGHRAHNYQFNAHGIELGYRYRGRARRRRHRRDPCRRRDPELHYSPPAAPAPVCRTRVWSATASNSRLSTSDGLGLRAPHRLRRRGVGEAAPGRRGDRGADRRSPHRPRATCSTRTASGPPAERSGRPGACWSARTGTSHGAPTS